MFLKQLSFSSPEQRKFRQEIKEPVNKRERKESIRAGVTKDEKRERDGGREESLRSSAVH